VSSLRRQEHEEDPQDHADGQGSRSDHRGPVAADRPGEELLAMKKRALAAEIEKAVKDGWAKTADWLRSLSEGLKSMLLHPSVYRWDGSTGAFQNQREKAEAVAKVRMLSVMAMVIYHIELHLKDEALPLLASVPSTH